VRRLGKDDEEFDQQVGRIAGLGEPIRRALYRLVAAAPEPVGREDAAVAVGVARHVAKFHLDRLEADGLLEAEYTRLEGRRGPGAGRPAKRYRRSAREVSVSLPPRRYDLAGHVMAQALVNSGTTGAPVAEMLRQAAIAQGRKIGESAGARFTSRHSPAARRAAVIGVLAEYGYEPRTTEDLTILVNCPFHALAYEHQDLVCGMNVDLIHGLLESCDGTGWREGLDPAPGRCCVTLVVRRDQTSRPVRSGR
jgi:predicted ArsR family transcriptional regulator